MIALRRLLPILLLVSMAGCSLKDPYQAPVEESFQNLYVPSDYGSIAAAVAASSRWDTIRIAPGDYEESFALPSDVSLFGEAADKTFILGEVEIDSSSTDARFERVLVRNPGGSGLILMGASPRIRHCRFEDCGGAGVEIVGNSSAEIEGCQITGNSTGLLIHDATLPGHYWDFDHLDGSAPKITSSNLFDNGGLDTLATNIVFENTSAPDTLGVSNNYWGIRPVSGEKADLTIYDLKDGAPHQNGLADTDDCLPSPYRLQMDWEYDD